VFARGTPTTEKDFQAQVLQLARLSGWLCYHTHDSRRSAPGFPDLVLVRPPVAVFAELKSASGKLRPEQREWLQALRASESFEVRLWRPGNWPEIVDTLAKRGELHGERTEVPRRAEKGERGPELR
jgi:hypothetical protein